MNEKSCLDESGFCGRILHTPKTSTEPWFNLEPEKNKNSPLWKCCNWCCSADWQSRWVKLGHSENMLIQLTLMTIQAKSHRKSFLLPLFEVWKSMIFVCFSSLELFSLLRDCSILNCSYQCIHSCWRRSIFSLLIFNDRTNNFVMLLKTLWSAYHKQKQMVSSAYEKAHK